MRTGGGFRCGFDARRFPSRPRSGGGFRRACGWGDRGGISTRLGRGEARVAAAHGGHLRCGGRGTSLSRRTGMPPSRLCGDAATLRGTLGMTRTWTLARRARFCGGTTGAAHPPRAQLPGRGDVGDVEASAASPRCGRHAHGCGDGGPQHTEMRAGTQGRGGGRRDTRGSAGDATRSARGGPRSPPRSCT